jgi:branched-chain amino acid transport system ATP-binding protein
MLKLRNVKAGYGRVNILENLNINVGEGQVVTIIGSNGAGKTTTLRAISGQIPLNAGEIEFDGQMISGLQAHDVVNRGVTMIPEARQLFPFMSVLDNLMLGAFKPSARDTAAEQLEEVLHLFPRVKERLSQQAGSLSGGEQQMVAIARGLMANPKLLMFDEPSLGLSPILVKQVFEIINKIVSSGRTVLLVEQNVFHSLKIADYGYVIENGRIVLEDTGQALLKNPHVKTAYLGI